MRIAFLPLLILLTSCDLAPVDSRFRATGDVIAFGGGDAGPKAACFTCHGMRGEGDGRDTPRLAGLDAGYLQRQLDDYANGRREHLAMRAIARKLTGADREKVSAHYAGLAAPPPPPPRPAHRVQADPATIRLYREGDPARRLPACATCHGGAGEGEGPGNPALAGQPAAYMEKQLALWRLGQRRGDGLSEMLAISRRLSPAESRALSVHAAGLPGAGPREARAASRAARHADPRNDASVPPRHEGES